MLKKTVFILFCVCLIGCKSQSITFDVSTNDSIKVTISSYDLKTDQDNFLVYDSDVKVAEGIFIPEETYQSLLKEKEEAELLEEDKKDGNPYFFCKNNTEYVYVIFLKDSHTGIFLTVSENQEEAEKIFASLDFKTVENS